MTDRESPFEQRLRAALAGSRPTETAPAALHGRIEAIPGAHPSGSFAGRFIRTLTAPASVALLVSAAVVGIATFALGKLGVSPNGGVGGGTGPAAAFDPTVEGPGLIRFSIPALQIAWGFSVLAALVLARRWRSRLGFDEWGDMGRSLLLVLLVAAPTVLVVQPPIRDFGGSQGAAVGFGAWVNPPPGADGPEVDYVNVVSGAPFIVFFDVTNASALPVTLNGMMSNDVPGSGGPRWIALALASVPNTFPNGIQDLRPFTPQVIAPNDRVTVYLVGKAGCTFGPGFGLDVPGVSGYASMSREVKLDYSIVGLASTTTFTMPMQVVEPEGPPCS